MKTCLAFFVFIFLGFMGFSQEDTTVYKLFNLDLEDLMNLKISSVSKTEEEVFNVPQTIIIITQEELFRRGYTDLEQVFHDLPGFDISRGNGTQYSQIYQRGYRSNNTERTSFQIDGVEENDLWSNSVWISRQYPLSNVKRIEIIYGPVSSMYGADAFVGVVNIVTKEANEIARGGSNLGFTAHAGYGTWNTKYVDATAAAQYKNVSLSLTGRIFLSDEMDLSKYKDWDYNLANYDANYYAQKLGTSNQTVIDRAMSLDQNAYYNDSGLNGIKPSYSNNTNDWLINGKLKVSNLTIGYQIFKRDEGYGGWYRDDYELGPKNKGKWVALNSFLYSKYTKKITKNLSFTSFSRFKIHGIDGTSKEDYYVGYMNGGLKLGGLIDTLGNLLPQGQQTSPYWLISWYNTYSQQLRFENRLNYTPSTNFNLTVGLEYRASFIQGKYFVSDKEIPEETAPALDVKGGNHFNSRDIGLFSMAKYSPIKNLDFIFGGRLDNNKIRVTGGYGTQFSPKVGLIYRPQSMSFKAIYSEAFMDASFWTKYGTIPARLLANPNLQPERVQNIEFIWSWKINKHLFSEISVYDAFYNGTVGTAEVTFVDDNGNTVETTQHQAIGSLQINGLQGRLVYQQGTFSAYTNYTLTNPNRINDDGSKTRIGDIAWYSANLGVNKLFFSKLNVNLRVNYVGDKPTGAKTTISANPYDQIDAYWILNGAVTVNLYKRSYLQVSFENLLNQEYYSPGVRSANGDYYAARIPQNERNFRVSLILK